MRDHGEHQAERAGERGVQRQDGVRAHSGKQAARLVSGEPAGQPGGGLESLETEARQGSRVSRDGPQRGQHRRQDEPGVTDQGSEQPLIGTGIRTEKARRLGD